MSDYLGMKPKPTPIPVVRDMMMALAKDLRRGVVSQFVAADRLERLAESTKRKSPVGVARKRIQPLTEGQKEAIRAEYRAHPYRSQLELAWMFKTNPGRISEALNEGRP